MPTMQLDCTFDTSKYACPTCVHADVVVYLSKYEMYMYVNKPSIKMVVTKVLFLGEFLQLGKKKERESSKKVIIFFLTSS